MSNAKCVLLTGATGFVGANLARRLLRDGHELHLLARPGYTAWRIDALRPHVRLHVVSLQDRERLDLLARNIRPDWVFHLAAYGAYSWQNDLPRMVETNLVGTINLVEACLHSGFEAFVNTGSSSEYGFKDHAPSEDDCPEPNSHYAVTKTSATLFCRHTARNQRVHLPTLRLYSVYGPYEEPGRLMPALALHGLQGGLPPLADPSVARDYVYVDDVSTAYVLAAARGAQEPGAIYNVGTGMQTTLHEVVEIARRVLGIRVEPRWGSMPNRSWDTHVWVANNRRIHTELGWTPACSFEEGFRRTANWFRDMAELPGIYGKYAVAG